MRKINVNRLGLGGSTVSFEDAEIAQAMDGEELAVDITGNEPEVADIATDVADAEQLEDKAISLEELAESADQITEATGPEVELVDLAANLAVSGTDAELEVFEAPEGGEVSTEAFVGRKISTEGIKSMAKEMWEAIKALVARIWEKILGFWRRMTDQVPGLVKKARALGLKAEEARGKTLKEDGGKIKLGAEGKRLIVNDAAPKTAADINAGLAALAKAGEQFLTGHAKRIQTAADALAGKVGKFDLDKPEESLASINATGKLAMKKADFSALHAVNGDSRFGKDLTVLRSEYLPNNMAVFAQTLSDKGDASALGDSQHIRSAGVSVLVSSEKPKEIKTVEFSTMTPSEVGALADTVEKLAGQIKDFNTKHLRGLEQAANKVKKAGADIAAKIDDKTSPLAVKCFNSAASYNTAVAKWSSAPFTQLTSLMIGSAHAAIAVGHKSLAQYK